MKKNVKLFTLTALASLLIGATTLADTLKVGATPVPHAELLNLVKPDLAKQGIELEIIEFTDYVTPNLALSDGELDANFFQHLPYLETFAKERRLDLVSAGNVHVEPIGLYSSKHDSLKDLKKRATIALPNDPANGGRALILLHNNGIITLKDPTNLLATEFDIVKNPKKLKFKLLEAAQLPRVLKDVDFAVINGNFALEAKLDPREDAVLTEGKESPYANIIAVEDGDQDDKEIVALLKALQSEKVRKYINDNYKGGVVPAF